MFGFNNSGPCFNLLYDFFKGDPSISGKSFVFFRIPLKRFHRMDLGQNGDIVNFLKQILSQPKSGPHTRILCYCFEALKRRFLTEEALYAGCQPVRRNQLLAGFMRDSPSPITGTSFMEARGEGFFV